MKPIFKIALFVVFFIALAGIGTALYFYNLKPADLSKVNPDFIMTPKSLLSEFENDETAATAKYSGKVIEISGKVMSVRVNDDKSINISLYADNIVSFVICTIPAASKKDQVNVGQEVKLRGKCAGFLMDVLMNECTIISIK